MKKFITISIIASSLLFAETNSSLNDKLLAEKLFNKAFKKQNTKKEFYMPLSVNGILQDEVFVKIVSPQEIYIKKETMEYIASLLKDEYKLKFEFGNFDKDGFTPLSSLHQFGITTKYDENNIIIDVQVPVNLKKASLIKLYRYNGRDVNGSIMPNDISGGVNLYLNQSYTKNATTGSFENSPINLSADLTLNVHNVVLEGRVQYREESKEEISRGRFRLSTDDIDNQIRYSLGDISLPHHNRLSFADTLGVGVEKMFNIGGGDYTQNISRVSSHEFFLQNKSRVEIFINERYTNSLNLPAGTHNIYDLSLPSGVNKVKLKIIEEGGKIEYLEFNDFSYSELLKKGLARYGFGVGIESKLQEEKWTYYKDKKVASAYIEYGLLESLTVESGVQNATDYIAGDMELLIGTNVGLFNPFIVASKKNDIVGYKKGLDYRTNLGSVSLNLGFEDIDSKYSNMSYTSTPNKLYRANIYTPLFYGINMGLSGSQYIKENEKENKYGATLSKSIGKWQLNLNFDESLKETQPNDKNVYLSVDYRFGNNSARYANYFEDKKEQFNLRYDEEGRYGLSSDLQYEKAQDADSYNIRTNIDDEKFRLDTTYNLRKSNNGKNESVNLALSSGFVFAGDTVAITAPMSSSFVIVNNDDKLENTMGIIGQQQSDDFIYDKFALDMSDYSQREFGVDETNLDFGIDLERSNQKFISNYKSGSLFEITAKGIYSVKGVLYDKESKKPLAYKAFKIFNTDSGLTSSSFTNDKGEFIINQTELGSYNASFVKDENYEDVARFSFDIKDGKETLHNLGDIFVQMPKRKEAIKYLVYDAITKSTTTIDATFGKLLDNIYFQRGSDAISKTIEDKLKALADALKRNSEVSLDIIGHADSVGDEQKNMELSHKRSLAVKSFLVKEGVDEDRLNALSKGDTQPISKNQEKNRRAEFKGLVEFKVK